MDKKKVYAKLLVTVVFSFLLVLVLNNFKISPYAISDQYNLSSCQTISTDGTYTLNQSINASVNCIMIASSDVILDCANNYSIEYGTNGSGVGIQTTGAANNVYIQNCNITKINDTGNAGIAIKLNTGATSVTIQNNNISTNGGTGNFGIQIVGGGGHVVQNNRIETDGTLGANAGVYGTASAPTIKGNNITTNGVGTLNVGIYMITSANALIFNNTVSTNGTSGNAGIFVDSASDLTNISQNNITTNGITNNGNNGISSTNTNALTVTDNIINTGGQNFNKGMFITVSSGHTVSRNKITTSGTTDNYGIHLTNSSISGTGNNISTSGTYAPVFNFEDSSTNSLSLTRMNSSTGWILSDADSDTDFTDLFFVSDEGEINISSVSISSSYSLNVTQGVNISSNNAFVNATEYSELNQSSTITLNNAEGREATIDENDNGTFVYCSSKCTFSSHTGNETVFSVTSFTSYSTVNITPNVTFTTPSNETTFNASDTFEIAANVTDNAGIDQVFIVIKRSSGSTVTTKFLTAQENGKYNTSYSIPSTGPNDNYTITLTAIDDNDIKNDSEMIHYTVINSESPSTGGDDTDSGGSSGGGGGGSSATEDDTSDDTELDLSELLNPDGDSGDDLPSDDPQSLEGLKTSPDSAESPLQFSLELLSENYLKIIIGVAILLVLLMVIQIVLTIVSRAKANNSSGQKGKDKALEGKKKPKRKRRHRRKH